MPGVSEGHFLTRAFLSGQFLELLCNTATIVHSGERLCTMLRHRNPVKINDFTLPGGTIVHSIHCVHIAFLSVTYYQAIISNYLF